MRQKMHAPSGSGNCPVCGGSGWELYTATCFEYEPPEELLFARKCTKCSGERRLADLTGVPEEYYDADFRKFDFGAYRVDLSKTKNLCGNMIRNYPEWEKAGKGLYIWSKMPGSGKTFLACCLAKTLMIKYDRQMKFVTATDYINTVGNSYNRERGMIDESEIFRTCDILVFDDIGAQADKDWQRQEIFRLSDSRMKNGNITIYTSNMNPGSLNVDERTKDRIIKQSIVLQMPEESIRRKKAQEEQNRFLQSVVGR